MDSCVFCGLGEKDRILEQNDICLVLASNPSLTLGHILVVPKRHIEKISELSEEEIIEIFSKLTKYQEIILRKFKGCDIRQNYRPFISDNLYKVSHLHFHLIPRENEDHLYKKSMIFEKELFRFLDKNNLDIEIKEVFGNAN